MIVPVLSASFQSRSVQYLCMGYGAKEWSVSKSDPRIIMGSCRCWEIDDLKEQASKLRDEV